MARLNMTQECVKPDEHCYGDHCFHRIMLSATASTFAFQWITQPTNAFQFIERMQGTETTHKHNVSMFVDTRLYRKIK